MFDWCCCFCCWIWWWWIWWWYEEDECTILRRICASWSSSLLWGPFDLGFWRNHWQRRVANGPQELPWDSPCLFLVLSMKTLVSVFFLLAFIVVLLSFLPFVLCFWCVRGEGIKVFSDCPCFACYEYKLNGPCWNFFIFFNKERKYRSCLYKKH